MGRVTAICISEKKGTEKKNVHSARLIANYGIENDAHAGNWHRQVSLISKDRIDEFNEKGAKVEDGAFGENIIVEGIDFKSLPIGTIFKCNDVILELTQIGKECHSHCAIYHRVGDCIMPREGVFAIVKEGGIISEGDELSIVSYGSIGEV
ncbi:MAG: MOSC domain-containing protein [Clostridiales bacterium]|nr:MOSC domain-containing protein [Clostridiales bacterium]